MTDVKPDDSSASSPNGRTGATADNDALRGLYKMSTTAGLGSGDYVAINATSVIAFLLGVASILAIVFGTPLLVVPAAAVVCGILALRQIQTSNGTQSGRLLAIGGLGLALVFGGMQLVRTVQQQSRQRADEQQLNEIISQLSQAVAAKDYDAAYALFSDRFAQRVSKTEFTQKWKPLENSPVLGSLKSIEGNGAFGFDVDPASEARYAMTLLIVTFEKATPSRLDMMFRHTGDKWVIENIPTLFPPAQQGGPPGMPPGAPGGPPGGAPPPM